MIIMDGINHTSNIHTYSTVNNNMLFTNTMTTLKTPVLTVKIEILIKILKKKKLFAVITGLIFTAKWKMDGKCLKHT